MKEGYVELLVFTGSECGFILYCYDVCTPVKEGYVELLVFTGSECGFILYCYDVCTPVKEGYVEVLGDFLKDLKSPYTSLMSKFWF